MLKEELIQMHEILAISVVFINESVRIINLCHKMTIHRIYILYTIFEDGKVYIDCCRVSITMFTQMH